MISQVCICPCPAPGAFPTTAAQKALVPVWKMHNYPRNVGLGVAWCQLCPSARQTSSPTTDCHAQRGFLLQERGQGENT